MPLKYPYSINMTNIRSEVSIHIDTWKKREKKKFIWAKQGVEDGCRMNFAYLFIGGIVGKVG